ncbi:MAG: hypothetical protein NC093_09015 [Alistipes sp.]|nr:hypothetical protein [Alistipes sp.]
MEQELASIFSFVLKSADSPQPYYRNIPQDFAVPSVYFPVPEISTGGDTFNTYEAEYDWYIKFFHSTTQEAYSLALKALTAIKENRNLIPLLDENGAKIGGIRIKDPDLRIVDECAVQLTIRFVSRRPYIQTSGPKVQEFTADTKIKSDS